MDAIFRIYAQMMHISWSTLEREQHFMRRDTDHGQVSSRSSICGHRSSLIFTATFIF